MIVHVSEEMLKNESGLYSARISFPWMSSQFRLENNIGKILEE